MKNPRKITVLNRQLANFRVLNPSVTNSLELLKEFTHSCQKIKGPKTQFIAQKPKKNDDKLKKILLEICSEVGFLLDLRLY